MAAAVSINKEVVLTESDNEYLKYPVRGLIDTAELDIYGNPIWATFRVLRDGKYGAPVVIRNFKTQ